MKKPSYVQLLKGAIKFAQQEVEFLKMVLAQCVTEKVVPKLITPVAWSLSPLRPVNDTGKFRQALKAVGMNGEGIIYNDKNVLQWSRRLKAWHCSVPANERVALGRELTRMFGSRLLDYGPWLSKDNVQSYVIHLSLGSSPDLV